jgi:hypothetical protein
MAGLTTAELDCIQAAQRQRLAFRDRTYLLICGGTGCHANGSIWKKKDGARIDKEKCIKCLTC